MYFSRSQYTKNSSLKRQQFPNGPSWNKSSITRWTNEKLYQFTLKRPSLGIDLNKLLSVNTRSFILKVYNKGAHILKAIYIRSHGKEILWGLFCWRFKSLNHLVTANKLFFLYVADHLNLLLRTLNITNNSYNLRKNSEKILKC